MAIRATGKVTRLYVHSTGVNVRLEIPENLRPLDNYFSFGSLPTQTTMRCIR